MFTIFMTTGFDSTAKEPGKTLDLGPKIKRFAPTDLTVSTSKLSTGDRAALAKLVEAAKLMDRIYIRQVWSGNEALKQKLEADRTPAGMERYHYYKINMSPWSKLDHDAPFIDGVGERPKEANYYPHDMTKKEFNTWLATLPEATQKNATGFFYTIRRGPDGKLMTVPYSEEYKDLLGPAAQLLRDAAALTDNASLNDFLKKRADAFLSNDYYESDVAWMDLDSPIEPTIGPYEVYMDELFNYKAAFEAFITLRNDAETNKLAKFSAYLQEIEDHLPIEQKYRNPKLGALSPIRVVDVVVAGGEPRTAVQTAAFNLPNDERVTTEKGSKRVMLKNVQEAKFNKALIPIARRTIDSKQRPLIAFDPFFTHILSHELMHGLGPHSITVNGKQTTVRQQMKELSSAIEEAKADIAGLFALQYLIDKGVLDKSMEEQMYVTFLAGVFRSVRFGTNDAHGRGMALQFNYLTDKGAFVFNARTGMFRVNVEKMKSASRELTGEIMTLQAQGSYAKAKAMLDRYGVIRPTMKEVLETLDDIPVDIEPRYVLAE
jgi:hypothetical protein